MSALSYVYAVMFYLAAFILVTGVLRRVWRYARTPAPLKIPTTPAPMTPLGVCGRLFREVVLFQSLYKASKWTWLFGWVFHFGLFVAALRHLQYVTDPPWIWVIQLHTVANYTGYAITFGLIGLWGRRLFVDRVRYITTPSDHLMIALILAIAGTGLLMKFVWYADVASLRQFMLGLIVFDIRTLPGDPVLLIHLALVIALMMVFPISKLLHAPGIFFSPTLNQSDSSRERRYSPGRGSTRG
ncbi:MAG: respiratory nitrate reductase subunit gamma [Pseudomonadota bacterium]